jgi:hypothetical protein
MFRPTPASWILAATLLMAPVVVNAHFNECLGYSVIAYNPWHDSVQKDNYFQVAGRVKHKGNKTGPVQVFCPVFNNVAPQKTTWNKFSILFEDPEGSKDDARVTASLRFVDREGGVQTVVALNSNEKNPPGIGVREMSAEIKHSFDFTNRFYYIQAGIVRSDASEKPALAAFNLCRIIQ